MSDTSAPHPPAAPMAALTEGWFTPRRFALALAALIAVAFPDVLLGVKSFYHRDFGVFGYPLAFYHRKCFWLDFLGVSQVTKAGSMLDWTFRPSFLPLVTAGQKPEFLDEAPTMRALASAAFQPTQVVFLPKGIQDRVRARERATVRLHDEQHGNHRLAFSVETPSPALVVVAQAYHPNWRAWVDGHQAELWRANYAFQALEVPAGQHRVELKYQDRAFAVGTIVSALALGLTLAGWIWLARTRDGKTPSACA